MSAEALKGITDTLELLKDPATLDTIRRNFVPLASVGVGTVTSLMLGAYALLRKAEFRGSAETGARLK
ncbi:MAG TPA: hypothetical protein VI819_05685 [Patescibacteria group bacterium]|nr:hypothetical protein [Patescibacteria group bacterium]